MVIFFFLMIRRPPRSTRTDTLFPYTTLFRALGLAIAEPVDLAPDPGLQLRSLFPPAFQLRPQRGDFILAGAQRIRLRRVPVMQPAHLSSDRLLQVGAGCVDPGTQAIQARQHVARDRGDTGGEPGHAIRTEAPTSELQSLLHNSYAVFCLK